MKPSVFEAFSVDENSPYKLTAATHKRHMQKLKEAIDHLTLINSHLRRSGVSSQADLPTVLRAALEYTIEASVILERTEY